MKVEFFSSDPRKKARTSMEEIMRYGTDQLVIATGFCTAAGIALLLAHTRRLGNNGSFVVVPSELPTDYPELAKLHAKIPGNLFVHWGSTSPTEKKGGAALMHSKVIYARSGQNCWLWTGSHNFTGNATQGGNCEAAVLLHGTADEKPFTDALAHLISCRDEATKYDPDMPPPNTTRREDILVVHAEGRLEGERALPCRIHLCLDSPDYDQMMAAPVPVRLNLYSHGDLAYGWQEAVPNSTYSGVLTGLNLTGTNPKVGPGGTRAEWSSADFNIEERDGVPVLGRPGPADRAVTTQAVLSITAVSKVEDFLFSERPRVDQRAISGPARFTALDADMRKFFKQSDISASGLRHVPIVGREQVIRVAEGDVSRRNYDRIRMRIAGRKDIQIENELPTQTQRQRRHPFIVRAKYRLLDSDN